MELVLAIIAGVLYATGVYLMLRRRLAQLIVGLGLLSNGSNVLILAAAGVTRGKPPIITETSMTADQFADPVPQSLILTAIVIGFGVLAFSLVLAHRVHQSVDTDDIDVIGSTFAEATADKSDFAEAASDKPERA
jgi:multicomponent Na+:H+ antiporter subunit C